MFRITPAIILDKDHYGIGETKVDIQPFHRIISFMDVDIGTQLTLDSTHRIFCDYTSLVNETSYFYLRGHAYKVCIIEDWNTYLQCTCIKTDNIVPKTFISGTTSL